MKGHYNDVRMRKVVDIKDPFLQQLNNGIAMVTPSYFLREIIYSEKVSKERSDLFDILRALRTIIMCEKGNHILVNVSVGSKIQAIASMMACMMFKEMATIRPYMSSLKDIILFYWTKKRIKKLKA